MLEFEPGLMIWTVVSFGLLVLLLYKAALPPILALLAQREKMIADSIELTMKNEKRSEELAAEYREKLNQINQKADRMIDESKKDGEKLKNEILERAEKQAELIALRASQDIARERDKIFAEVRRSTAELVALAAGKVLRKTISPADNRRLIEESLTQARP
ncbi:ATP synthase F0 subunit B [candidate division WOR-1 bacterium RIFCSPHIGHO2_01_FULL_53_15]|uniref:ATP synthase subunit b n=1 Tax=candidate division WOR-1 bacterium RIFCSPHIGHO2_01_FULL_53_15 TaxID=1802564 RepID=A0A1F4Q1F1_UNCSA|nr:MAG: ATP synthase F0 subunit B [candidate division WOR-1 bacterium RIFCSPHIGHO2_01_FULL_53_15]OGC12808.1 MAG: ATP synthase F0 subunit B [candidate division WOR-1 bacterium RIFCSPHIGHO2_02_FULL_53_26]